MSLLHGKLAISLKLTTIFCSMSKIDLVNFYEKAEEKQ